jgi:hypothetical protein
MIRFYSIVRDRGRGSRLFETWCDGAQKSSNIVFVELIGIEPMTSGLQSPRSPS